ncbi:MAG: hypothetical protein ABFS14_03750 [Gemmatimonadota bacterium]
MDTKGTELDTEVVHKLRELGRAVSPIEISDLWIFPPLVDLASSTEFFLFTRFLSADTRRLCAARIEAGNGRSGPAVEEVTEFGVVPSGRLERLIEGFKRRLGEEREPAYYRLDGCPQTWDRLVTLEPVPALG